MFFGAFGFPEHIHFDLALMVIIVCYGVFTLFALVTLPVEINASQRALPGLTMPTLPVMIQHLRPKMH